MAMPHYPLPCYTSACPNLAEYKIAARWSDGMIGELKTYGLCCGTCLPDWFRRGRQKQAACRLAPGESLEAPGIYHLKRGQRDRQLERMEDLEKQLLGKAGE